MVLVVVDGWLVLARVGILAVGGRNLSTPRAVHRRIRLYIYYYCMLLTKTPRADNAI